MRIPKKQPCESFDSFEAFFEQSEQRPGYWLELAKLDFTREVLERMKHLGVTKSQLAVKLEAKPALVTRLLSGKNNFELATMVRLARVLDCEFRSHLQPKGTTAMWLDVLSEEPARPAERAWNPKDYKPVATEKESLCNVPLPAAT